MKRRLTVLLVTLGMMMFSLVPAASAHTEPCETGRQYAQEHIVPAAHAGQLGKVHKPGTHQGFSNVPDVCTTHD